MVYPSFLEHRNISRAHLQSGRTFDSDGNSPHFGWHYLPVLRVASAFCWRLQLLCL